MKTAKFLLAVWSLSCWTLHAEIIDRMMAVVNGRMITLGDVRVERDLQGVFGGNPASEEVILQNMVEQYLIEEQIAQFPGIEVSVGEIDSAFALFKNPGTVPEQSIRAALRKRIERSRYFDLRFRQFITVTDDEVRRYYDTVFLPAARDRGVATVPALPGISADIRANVVDEKMNQEVASWLDAIRERSEIEIFK